jgi:hypothetical protein
MKNFIKESVYWVFVALFLTLAISSYLLLIGLLIIADMIFIPCCFLFGLFRWSLTDRDSILTSIKKEFKVLYDLHDMIVAWPFRR